jgi:predicted DNA-binding transcriptional regulator AlpA
MDNQNYLTVGEVAQLVGKSQKWVYQHQREIPGWFTLAGSILFDRTILIEELKKRAKQSARVAVARGNHNL